MAATIEIVDSTTSAVLYTAETNIAGNYTISDIAVGTYAVTATPTANSGYQPTTIHDVTISADTTLNFALVPATCSVEVAGVVRDSAGTPVPGLRVAASCGSSVAGQ